MTRTTDTPNPPAPTLSERPFAPASDLPAMVRLISDVNAFDKVDWYPTVENLANEWSPSMMFDPLRDVRIIDGADGIAAASRMGWREREGKVVHRIEVWVHPDHRRQGLGRRLLAWSEDRARASIVEGSGGSTSVPHVFGANTADHVAAGVAFAEASGYLAVRFHYKMRRELAGPIPDLPLPEGLEIRPVLPEHHRAIFEADHEAFLDHWDAAETTEADFVRWFAEPDLDTSLWQVAWDGDEIAGLVINGIYPHENERTGIDVGWLDSVATRRPWRRRGLAAALIARSLVVLRARGMAMAALGVDAESPTGALRLYERFDFRRQHAWIFYRKPI
jgi:mycothiol synthase